MDSETPHDVQEDVPIPRPRLLRIAIVGGGIGGLALATFLAAPLTSSGCSTGLEVSIYEAAPSLTELGAGVGVWLRTWRILSAAGLAHDLTSIVPPGRDMSEGPHKAFEFRRGDCAPEGRSFYIMDVPFGVLTLHRADFQRVLAQHAIPPAEPHFGKRLVGYDYADENKLSPAIVLKFADGSTSYADILVGADGIRSTVRREIIRRLAARSKMTRELEGSLSAASVMDAKETFPMTCTHQPSEQKPSDTEQFSTDLIEPVWSGTLVYRSLILLSALEKRFPGHRAGRGPIVYFGKNKHVIAFPLFAGGNTGAQPEAQTPTPMVNLVAFTSDPKLEGTQLPPGEPWVRSASREELLKKFRGWEDEVVTLLELAEKPSLWAIHTVKPLPSYSDADGRVVLLGDAAHAMTPHQGAGGGQAIEDAHVLAALLSHPRTTRETLPDALRAYDTVRMPISQGVASSSRLNGMMYEFNYAWESGGSKPDCIGDADILGEIEEGEDAELMRLCRLADAIMEIHKWEWEGEPEDHQATQAVRLFEESYDKKSVAGEGVKAIY